MPVWAERQGGEAAAETAFPVVFFAACVVLLALVDLQTCSTYVEASASANLGAGMTRAAW